MLELREKPQMRCVLPSTRMSLQDESEVVQSQPKIVKPVRVPETAAIEMAPLDAVTA